MDAEAGGQRDGGRRGACLVSRCLPEIFLDFEGERGHPKPVQVISVTTRRAGKMTLGTCSYTRRRTRRHCRDIPAENGLFDKLRRGCASRTSRFCTRGGFSPWMLSVFWAPAPRLSPEGARNAASETLPRTQTRTCTLARACLLGQRGEGCKHLPQEF